MRQLPFLKLLKLITIDKKEKWEDTVGSIFCHKSDGMCTDRTIRKKLDAMNRRYNKRR